MTSVEVVVEAARSPAGPYVEFLRVPSMSAGVYVLPKDGVDRQSPHAEDELYYVVRGRGRFRHGTDERPIRAGDALFVSAREPHRFVAIEEELVLFVVFSPPESTGPGSV